MLQIDASRLLALNMGRRAAMKGLQVDFFGSALEQDKRQAGTDCSEQSLEPRRNRSISAISAFQYNFGCDNLV